MEWGDLHFLLGLLPINGMLGVIIVSHFLADRRTASRSTVDALRLRTALHTELVSLQQLYRTNMGLLEEGGAYLLSSRPFVAVYRANLGRLTLFDDSELPTIIATYAYCDVVEGTVAATTKPLGSLAYRVLQGEVPLDLLRREFAEAIGRVDAALAALEHRRVSTRARLLDLRSRPRSLFQSRDDDPRRATEEAVVESGDPWRPASVGEHEVAAE